MLVLIKMSVSLNGTKRDLHIPFFRAKTAKTHNSCLCVHKACLSLNKNSCVMFLCVLGVTMSNQTLKGVDTWERPWDVYTGVGGGGSA